MKERDLSLDVIKILAMIGVVSLHTTCMYERNCLTLILGYLSLVSVPLFFMSSGYVMLRKDKITYRYALSKVLKILRYVAFFCASLFFIISIKEGTLNVCNFVTLYVGAFFQKGVFWIFWYFGAMIIIYLILPYLHKLFKTHFTYFIYIIFLLLIIESVISTANVTTQFESSIPQSLRIWNWLFFFCLGGVIYRIEDKIPKVSNIVLLVLSIIFINYAVVFNPLWWTELGEFYYSSFALISLVVALFIAIKQKKYTNSKVIGQLSLCFLPIYTFHPFIVRFVTKIAFWANWYIGGVIQLIICFLITLSISIIIMKIPYINKIFKI